MNIFKIPARAALPGKKTLGCVVETGEFAGNLELIANARWNQAWVAANCEKVTAPLFVFGPSNRVQGNYEGTGSVWWEPSRKHVGRFTKSGKDYEVTVEITDGKTYEGTMTFIELTPPSEDALVLAAAPAAETAPAEADPAEADQAA